MEQIAYVLKHQLPLVFRAIEPLSRAVVVLRYGSKIQRVLMDSTLYGTVNGRPAVMRKLIKDDAVALTEFLTSMPHGHLEYFSPHSFERKDIERILSSQAFMTYGLFADSSLIGYALLKIAPTGSAFIGLLADPKWSGCGIGRFIVAFLYWQASLVGLRARSTLSKHNAASIQAHEAVSAFKTIAELPNDYIMIEFPQQARSAPDLQLHRGHE